MFRYNPRLRTTFRHGLDAFLLKIDFQKKLFFYF